MQKYLVAGPCSAETAAQIDEAAEALALAFAQNGREYDCFFRAGLWKPRTHPGCFEGMGTSGIASLVAASQRYGLKPCTEVTSAQQAVEVINAGFAGFWTGARTGANPVLVSEIARASANAASKAGVLDSFQIFVKNPVNPDLELWIGNTERFISCGFKRVAAVHRGFSQWGESAFRNAPIWSIAVDYKLRMPSVPLLCDPSHIGGKRNLVASLAQHSLDLNFDGLMVEVHPHPQEALSDSAQQLSPYDFVQMLSSLCFRNSTAPLSEIDALREQIDVTDNALLEVLSRRMEISRKIGEIKRRESMAILQPERWNSLLERICAQATLKGLDSDFIRRLYSLIHHYSIKRQE